MLTNPAVIILLFLFFFSIPDSRGRNEFSSLVKLSHPNIVRYFAMNLKEHGLIPSWWIFWWSTLMGSPSQPTWATRAPSRSISRQVHSSALVRPRLLAQQFRSAQGSERIECPGGCRAPSRLRTTAFLKRLADICKEDVFEQTRVRFQ